MSKKNNKNKMKAYADHCKEKEMKDEARRLEKMNKRDTNRITNAVANEINEISLTVEKADKMSVDKPETKKRAKIIAKKHKSRY